MGGNLPFRCFITNTCGSVTSDAATLTVNPCALADIASDSADTTRNPNNSSGPEHLEAFVNSFIAG